MSLIMFSYELQRYISIGELKAGVDKNATVKFYVVFESTEYKRKGMDEFESTKVCLKSKMVEIINAVIL